MKPIQIYAVGGCVRDLLLNKQGIATQTNDRDWVVVGATPQIMVARGFIPVGADFPVFLHPDTHEEYALARTERKTAAGYHGFSFYTAPTVTLHDDLARRDLTVNAMAMDEQGQLIDPYGGEKDLADRVFRHVGPAFAEDPVRILRVARFAARFPMFTVACSTQALLSQMVRDGEADALVPERVWAEISRGLMEARPSRLLEVLSDCGYWQRALSAVTLSPALVQALDRAAREGASLGVRCALLFSSVRPEAANRRLTQSLRAPADVTGLCALFVRLGTDLLQAHSARDFVQIFSTADVTRRPRRFEEFVQALYLLEDFDAAQTRRLCAAFLAVDAGAVARAQSDPRSIPQAVLDERFRQVSLHLHSVSVPDGRS